MCYFFSCNPIILANLDKFMFQIFQKNAWETKISISNKLWGFSSPASLKRTERWLNENDLNFEPLNLDALRDEYDRKPRNYVASYLVNKNIKTRKTVLFGALFILQDNYFLAFNDNRKKRYWLFFAGKPTIEKIICAINSLSDLINKDLYLLPTGKLVNFCRKINSSWTNSNELQIRIGLEIYYHSRKDFLNKGYKIKQQNNANNLSHLDYLESEAIHIIREAVNYGQNPVMMYSIGKDSSVMLHLAKKAFYPSPPPFPLLHVDTRWKFRDMYEFRDFIAKSSEMSLIIHVNPEGITENINPISHGSSVHTDIMKTQALKQALEKNNFDVVFGGARRDEEKSRSKERIFSFRDSSHRWDPKNQRAELWNIYNGNKRDDQSIRVFPLSNWTEIDIWQYIYKENIPIVPLYFAAKRPVVQRNDMLVLVDDDRLKIKKTEKIELKSVRFRTLGCYPLTGAMESDAADLPSIILEIINSKTSERQGRVIDSDSDSSMEKKKGEGYF